MSVPQSLNVFEPQILYLGVSGSLNETELRKAIDMYDVSMSVKPAIHRRKRWDLWGGLYYAGTIYTTIGESASKGGACPKMHPVHSSPALGFCAPQTIDVECLI